MIKELSEKISKGKEFRFWEYLDKLEVFVNKFDEKNSGTIEKNVIINGKLFLGKNSVIKSGTRIEGNVVVGKNCVIGPNAFLRKNVLIEDNCKIANSEIKNSIILKNSNIPHFSYVGDSILGENVNFGAGTKIANLRFDNKNINVAIEGKKINSKRRKLGALIGHNTKTGINSGINCGIIIGNNQKIFPGKIVSKNLKSL